MVILIKSSIDGVYHPPLIEPFAMNLNQLKIFYAVAQKKSFTMAARELFLTQPAVTIQIQKVEREYETKLFDRIGKKIFLTESGKILFS
ncbi:MAG: LysR family transcriptional regulator [Candidatus Zixiibacteriota bacterium]